MEGSLDAKLLVEDLEIAGANPTPAKLAAAFDAPRNSTGVARRSLHAEGPRGVECVELTVLTTSAVDSRCPPVP
ncbi:MULTISPECIES: hypothetical protein [unclassified Variovorax]|uniref:hypothetical protein n=1 Tax=unclassified Variovorax TaxID=663243 RepID=UPI001160758C|nr:MULTISPECIES: hypothetical protein [unclassified Variovorax]